MQVCWHFLQYETEGLLKAPKKQPEPKRCRHQKLSKLLFHFLIECSACIVSHLDGIHEGFQHLPHVLGLFLCYRTATPKLCKPDMYLPRLSTIVCKFVQAMQFHCALGACPDCNLCPVCRLHQEGSHCGGQASRVHAGQHCRGLWHGAEPDLHGG